MHILFISEYYPPLIRGGGEINLNTLAKALAASGHTISILTSNFPHLPAYEQQAGVQIYRRLKTGENPGSLYSNIARSLLFPKSVAIEAAKLTSEINPEIIHFIGTSIIAAPTLKSLHKPLFATIESYPTLCPKGDRWYHGKEECKIKCNLSEFISCQRHSDEIGKMKNKWYLKYNPLFLFYVYHYYKRLNRALSSCNLISISRYVQQLLLQQGYQSTVIPNILDLKPFAAAKKNLKREQENKKIENTKTRLLYLGSLIKSKGPHFLLEAMNGVDCRCDFYGEGNLQSELQEYIAKNNLDAEIHPLVSYDLIPELYAETDIVVFPSIWPEPFGRIAIEAQAAGKMVIASNIGAIPETVGKGGILVTPGNSQELRKAIITALDSFKKPKASLVQYHPSNILAQLLNAYKEKI